MSYDKSPDKKMNRAAIIILICLITAGAVCFSVSVGVVAVHPGKIFQIIVNHISGGERFAPSWEENVEKIIWNIRFPRVLTAWLVGAGLSVCGVLMQALTKNPLADPYVLGVSSGASTGAVCAIVLGIFSFAGVYSTMLGAVIGAACSIIITMGIAGWRTKVTSTRLILAGIATSALFSALTNMVIYGFHTGSDKTKTAQFWMVGSLGGADWETVGYTALVFFAAVGFILLFSRELDILLLGDEEAESLGVDTGRTKAAIIFFSTILVGAVVSVSGVIGFVGLVIPHIVRALVGTGHSRLIPASILTGGLFTVLADVVSRVAAAPAELPIGIICALTGAPFFFYLIRKNRKAGRV